MLLVPEARFPKHEIERCVKRNKSDAEAICEAATRPNMRFVPIRTPEQQSVLKLHRTRQLFVRQRTTLINAILAELGVVAGVGRVVDQTATASAFSSILPISFRCA